MLRSVSEFNNSTFTTFHNHITTYIISGDISWSPHGCSQILFLSKQFKDFNHFYNEKLNFSLISRCCSFPPTNTSLVIVAKESLFHPPTKLQFLLPMLASESTSTSQLQQTLLCFYLNTCCHYVPVGLRS